LQRLCEVDGVEFEARRSTAKYCSDKCRQRARRGTKAAAAVARTSTDEQAGGLVEAVRKQLAEAGRLNTVDGQAALVLAKQATATGATGVSALIKEMRQVLSAAMVGVEAPSPPGSVVPEDQLTKARKAREQKARQAARRA
jgi:hypothetical protein